MVRGPKISIFRGPGTKNIGFLCSGDQKYQFIVVPKSKILIFLWSGNQRLSIFCGPGTKNIDFSWSEKLCNLQESQKLEKQWKIMVSVGKILIFCGLERVPGRGRGVPGRQQPGGPGPATY